MLKSSIIVKEVTYNSRELKALRDTENCMQVAAMRSLEDICSTSMFMGIQFGKEHLSYTHLREL